MKYIHEVEEKYYEFSLPRAHARALDCQDECVELRVW